MEVESLQALLCFVLDELDLFFRFGLWVVVNLIVVELELSLGFELFG